MAAAFGESLVFDLDHRGPGALKVTHGALGVERIAKARVGIDDDRDVHPVGDVGQGLRHFGGGRQADVRAAQAGIGDRCP